MENPEVHYPKASKWVTPMFVIVVAILVVAMVRGVYLANNTVDACTAAGGRIIHRTNLCIKPECLIRTR